MKLISFCVFMVLSFSLSAQAHHPNHGQNGGMVDKYSQEPVLVFKSRILDYTGYTDRGNDTDIDKEDVHMCGFERVQVRTRNEDVKVEEIRVVFGDGSSYRLPIMNGSILRAGSETSFYNLPNKMTKFGDGNPANNNDRCIKRVLVLGESWTVGESNDREDLGIVRIWGIR